MKLIHIGACLLSGCGAVNFTGTTEVTTPAEAYAVKMVDCHVAWHKTQPIEVMFHDARRGQDGAHAWADYLGRVVHVAKPSLESWAPVDIEMVMGHEVCHILGFGNEDTATACASLAYYNAGCH